MNHQQFINFTSDRVHQKAYTYMYRSLYIRLFLRTNDLSLQNIIDDTYTQERERERGLRQYYSE